MAHRRGTEGVPLDLVPIMNLVTILIPFLLMSAQFVHLAVIDSTLPAIGPPQELQEEDDEPPLLLSVAITDQGFTLLGDNGVVTGDPDAEGEEAAAPIEGEVAEPTIPCSERPCSGPESYDYAELTRLVGLIKDEYPDDENVSLVPESRIPYEVIVTTMDASREDPDTKGDNGQARELFPFVVIAGGAQ
ncbi:MAG TPA: biopolymer transporter ExbD [Myxococcota bacterium]|nr:biopolymer transporter ExbD [Myxococcota bacterium]